jgi:hypothetical protein
VGGEWSKAVRTGLAERLAGWRVEPAGITARYRALPLREAFKAQTPRDPERNRFGGAMAPYADALVPRPPCPVHPPAWCSSGVTPKAPYRASDSWTPTSMGLRCLTHSPPYPTPPP